MMFLTYPVSFSSIACIYFSKWRIKIFGRGNHPPYTRTLTGYPTPVLGGTPEFFFAKMTAKDELKGIKNPRVSFFWVFMLQKKIPWGGNQCI